MTRPAPAIPSGVPTRSGERADQSTVRHANLGTVLRHVAELGPCSRAAVASGTGLTRGTVSSLVGELIELGLVRESAQPAKPRGIGRPGIAIELGGTVAAIGLEVNVDYLAVCVEDVRGDVRYDERVSLDNRLSAPGPVLDHLAQMATSAFAAAAAADLRVAGVTVAVPGLVRIATGTLLRAPNLGWEEIEVGAELRDRLGTRTPVLVDNEANLAAIAEHRLGAARGLDSFALVLGEVGVGGGVFVDGELYRGAHGYGGEIGHVTVDPDGPLCACGSRGCLETLVGQEAIARRAGIQVPAVMQVRSLTEELVRHAQAGDPRTLSALGAAALTLGEALASTVNLFDLEGIVLGGAYGPLAPWLLDGVAEALRQHVLASRWSTCELRVSSFGEDAPVRGAAAVILRSVAAAPWLVRSLEERKAVVAE